MKSKSHIATDGKTLKKVGKANNPKLIAAICAIFWLRDESLEDNASLPDPDVIATEIMADLEVALEQFRQIAEQLGVEE